MQTIAPPAVENYDAPMLEQPTLTLPGFEFYPTGIVTRPDVTHDQWHAAYAAILPFARGVHWWIGELIRFGEFKGWMSDLSDGRLANIASVCGRVHIARRRADLSFSHHEAVAPLQPQEQRIMLASAVDNQWSVRALYAKITAGRADGTLSTHTRAATRIAVLRSARGVLVNQNGDGMITVRITDPDLLTALAQVNDGDDVRISLAIERAPPTQID